MTGPTLAEVAAAVTALLAAGDEKAAVEKAKAFHKQARSQESEELLTRAYAARVAGMRRKGLEAEAASLENLVRERYNVRSERWSEAASQAAGAARQALDALLVELRAEGVSRERRAEIEATLVRTLRDPAMLLHSAALPADDPLRVAAAQTVAALEAAAAGPVEPSEVELPGVSFRSPLAPWKSVARALAAFHRRDDDACARALQTIDPSSPAARVKPILEKLMAREPSPSQARPATRALFAEVQGAHEELRSALAKVDDLFRHGKQRDLLAAIAAAVALCKKARPELVTSLRERIGARGFARDLPVGPLRDALGGALDASPSYTRLLARVAEARGELLGALARWEQFRILALATGLFGPDGVEEAVLLRRQARLARAVPAMQRSDFQRQLGRSLETIGAVADTGKKRGRGKKALDAKWAEPGRLLDRANAADPTPQGFRDRFELARSEEPENDKLSVDIAQRWRGAFPNDVEPLLLLADLAERRGDLAEALRLLDQADQLGTLEPNVRRAQWRVLLRQAAWHYEKRELQLLEDAVSRLRAHPAAAENERGNILLAIDLLQERLRRPSVPFEDRMAEVERAFGGPVGARVLLRGLAGKSAREWRLPVNPGDLPGKPGHSDLLRGVAHASLALLDAGIEVPFPPSWHRPVTAAARDPQVKLESRLWRALGTVSLARDALALAYAISGRGMALGGADSAWFLYARGRAVDEELEDRQAECFLAAVTLARRFGDQSVIQDSLEELHFLYAFGAPGPDETRRFELAPEDLDAVVAHELKVDYKAPALRPRGLEDDDLETSGICPECGIDHNEEFDPFVSRPRPRQRQTKRKAPAAAPDGAQGTLFEREDNDEDDLDSDEAFPLEVVTLLREMLRGDPAKLKKVDKYLQPGRPLPDPQTLQRTDPAAFRILGEVMQTLREVAEGSQPRRKKR